MNRGRGLLGRLALAALLAPLALSGCGSTHHQAAVAAPVAHCIRRWNANATKIRRAGMLPYLPHPEKYGANVRELHGHCVVAIVSPRHAALIFAEGTKIKPVSDFYFAGSIPWRRLAPDRRVSYAHWTYDVHLVAP